MLICIEALSVFVRKSEQGTYITGHFEIFKMPNQVGTLFKLSWNTWVPLYTHAKLSLKAWRSEVSAGSRVSEYVQLVLPLVYALRKNALFFAHNHCPKQQNLYGTDWTCCNKMYNWGKKSLPCVSHTTARILSLSPCLLFYATDNLSNIRYFF